MMTSATQLKDYIKNLAKQKNINPQILLRMYMMERFLERLANSKYKNNLIMKGGTLVAAMVGVDLRATMDLDVTITGVSLNVADAELVIKNICNVNLHDGIVFQIKNLLPIMDEADYSGLRVSMIAEFDKIRIPLKIDISTGDVITPKAIEYQYGLLLENRSIALLAYNLETVLAEKLDTIIERDISNTRMRDFYDIYILQKLYIDKIDGAVLAKALAATAKKRNSSALYQDAENILLAVKNSGRMAALWNNYGKNYRYAQNIKWEEAIRAVSVVYKLTK